MACGKVIDESALVESLKQSDTFAPQVGYLKVEHYRQLTSLQLITRLFPHIALHTEAALKIVTCAR